MKRNALLAACLLAAPALTSCSGGIVHHYRTMKVAAEPEGVTLCDVSVFAVEPAPTSKPYIHEAMDPFGRVAYFLGAAWRAPDAKTYGDLVTKSKADPPEQASVYRTTFKRTIAISVQRPIQTEEKGMKFNRPGNRIERAEVTISPAGGAEIAGWSRISTQYETVKIGELTESETTVVGGTLGLGGVPIPQLPGATGTATANYQQTDASTASSSLSLKLATVSGSVSNGAASLFLQGYRGADVTGTTTADVVLKVPHLDTPFEVIKFREFEDKNGMPLSPGDLKGLVQNHYIPEAAADIEAEVSLNYAFRYVRDDIGLERLTGFGSGGDSVNEGDDRALLYVGLNRGGAKFLLLPGSEQKVAFWGVAAIPEGADLPQARALDLKHPSSPIDTQSELPQGVRFDSLAAALAFERWANSVGQDTTNKAEDPIPLLGGIQVVLRGTDGKAHPLTYNDLKNMKAYALPRFQM